MTGMYEIHVTVNGATGLPASMRRRLAREYMANLRQIARALGWRTSTINEPGLTRFYFTAMSSDLWKAHDRMEALTRELRAHGVPVEREKIEHIVYDTKAAPT